MVEGAPEDPAAMAALEDAIRRAELRMKVGGRRRSNKPGLPRPDQE
jgi:hypothetical protein